MSAVSVTARHAPGMAHVWPPSRLVYAALGTVACTASRRQAVGVLSTSVVLVAALDRYWMHSVSAAVAAIPSWQQMGRAVGQAP